MHTRVVSWVGEARIEPGRLVYRGLIGAAHSHAHAAVQIAAISGDGIALTDGAGRREQAVAAVIAAGATHAVDAGSSSGIMIYLEPTGTVGRRVSSLFEGRDAGNVRSWVAVARNVSNDVAAGCLSAVADAVVDESIGADVRPGDHAADPRVRDAVDVLPTMLSGPVRLTDVAQLIHLSADRLGRLFARDIGMSFPAYVRWSRLVRAMEVARDGGTITDAAHAAGFSDSAHANRVFHEMFGLSPIDVRRGVRLT